MRSRLDTARAIAMHTTASETIRINVSPGLDLRYLLPPEPPNTRFAGTPGRLEPERPIPLGEGVECTLDLPGCCDEEVPLPLLLEREVGEGAGAVRTEGEGRARDGAEPTDGGALDGRGLTEPLLDRYGSDVRDGGCACDCTCGCVSGRDDGRDDGRMIGDDPDARGCTRMGLPLLVRVLPPLPR